eukprot:CAMPEP_0206600312 /NCGR_PEP_ID=MMETSP0325_2-20121206/45718_1 /ASSEMBLY_ACC=CAM_ASM_000347 /TAXON_ID=2866 /ORGANISM="Crypthecodinium cohnii, Strain Seligo" /LENGTH=148 /DNA_ID=CAMNT_0054111587 /DNA_START=107 /DNA_END=552 /DNA_ORIENTATION=+
MKSGTMDPLGTSRLKFCYEEELQVPEFSRWQSNRRRKHVGKLERRAENGRTVELWPPLAGSRSGHGGERSERPQHGRNVHRHALLLEKQGPDSGVQKQTGDWDVSEHACITSVGSAGGFQARQSPQQRQIFSRQPFFSEGDSLKEPDK